MYFQCYFASHLKLLINHFYEQILWFLLKHQSVIFFIKGYFGFNNWNFQRANRYRRRNHYHTCIGSFLWSLATYGPGHDIGINGSAYWIACRLDILQSRFCGFKNCGPYMCRILFWWAYRRKICDGDFRPVIAEDFWHSIAPCFPQDDSL